MSTDPDPSLTKRHIRSFVMRRGHITQGQKRAYDALLPQFLVPYQEQILDTTHVFGRSAPLVLEIGFGMGETTAQMAAACPQLNFLGVEVYMPGVGALARRAHDMQLSNLRIIRHDAVEVITQMISPESLDGVHIYFPDPWPKLRHHKRRLVASPFISLLAQRLKKGGYLHCATDWAQYAEQMHQVLSNEPLLVNAHQAFAPAPENPLCKRPNTKFQTRGERLGHNIWDLVFLRRP